VKLPPPASGRERTKTIVALLLDACPPKKYKIFTILQNLMNEYDFSEGGFCEACMKIWIIVLTKKEKK
jgi:hypothetical protein